jgi:hypothetical protein
MPYWLSSGLRPAPHYVIPPSTTLSQEEFNALPEILYQPVPEGEEDSVSSEAEIVVGNISGANEFSELPSISIVLPEAPSIELPEVPAVGRDMDAGGVVEEEEEKVDVEQPIPVEEPSSDQQLESGTIDMSTTCTMCSICIDEFEAGERLTLLPRCQHAFHRDCIMPWLMERQGCCPLCKKHVLHAEQQTDSEGSSDE